MDGLSTMVDKRRRQRRTNAEMKHIRENMIRLARDNNPFTIRQMFYLMVTAAIIDKTESNYKDVVIRLCLELRQAGLIPWDWVVDHTRYFFKPNSFDSLQDALNETARVYRRSYWAESNIQIQIWCESMSAAGIIKPETTLWDVPLYPGKGFTSHSFVRDAGRSIATDGRPAVIYVLGDHDPSGRAIIRNVEKLIRGYAGEVNSSVDIEFEELAVTPEQIEDWSLPGHPSKKGGPHYAKSRIDYAVELEAIPPDRLRALVKNCIQQHIDPDAYERMMEVEAAERETLMGIAAILTTKDGADSQEEPDS
jgi:hypothetical protein